MVRVKCRDSNTEAFFRLWRRSRNNVTEIFSRGLDHSGVNGVKNVLKPIQIGQSYHVVCFHMKCSTLESFEEGKNLSTENTSDKACGGSKAEHVWEGVSKNYSLLWDDTREEIRNSSSENISGMIDIILRVFFRISTILYRFQREYYHRPEILSFLSRCFNNTMN